MAAHQESDNSSPPEELLHPSEDLPTMHQKPDEDLPTIREEQPETDLSTIKQAPQEDLPELQQKEPDKDLLTVQQTKPEEDTPTIHQEPDEDLLTVQQAKPEEDLPTIQQDPPTTTLAEPDEDLPTVQVQPEHQEDAALSPALEDDEDEKERTQPSLPRIRATRVQTQPLPQLAELVSSPEDATIVQPPTPADPTSSDVTTRVQTQPLQQLAEPLSPLEDATITQVPFPDAPTVRQTPPPPPPVWYQEQFYQLPTAKPASPHVVTLANATMPLGAVRRIPRGVEALKGNRPLAIVLIVLVLLLIAGGVYAFGVRDILSADSAVVQITPVSQTISNQYAMTAVLGTPDSSSTQVAAHVITQSTAAKSMTVQATGHGHAAATYGQGTVSVMVVQGSFANTNLHLVSNSGVSIVITLTGTLNVGGTGNFPASATNAGPGGNIPAFDINGNYIENGTSNILFVQNTAAFSGGRDARDFTAVQQSDIDNAAQQLQAQISTADTSDAQTKAQNQLGFGEQFFNSVHCDPAVSANHQANDEAANVTVSVAMKCSGVAYNASDMQANAAKLLGDDATSQLGSGYIPSGHVIVSIVSVSPFQVGDSQITFQVSARGVWSYFFSFDQQNALASLVADKKQADAKDLLVKQHGIASATIDTSGGLGTALPKSQHIQIVIVSVKGL